MAYHPLIKAAAHQMDAGLVSLRH